MTALDKQAREFLPDEWADSEKVAELVKLLTQVREQTVAECAQFVEEKERAAFEITDEDWHSVLAEEIRALPAPPETTEQDKEKSK